MVVAPMGEVVKHHVSSIVSKHYNACAYFLAGPSHADCRLRAAAGVWLESWNLLLN